ncbi:hypothetical protein [Halegenticoccus soli]|uniref:hypothetical protein n=1 Tax=Halegenticoccus soli TaxID=1985678 RepID=UPI000C6E9E28|nr:hypothetical protein [Halegenticoccus soli]
MKRSTQNTETNRGGTEPEGDLPSESAVPGYGDEDVLADLEERVTDVLAREFRPPARRALNRWTVLSVSGLVSVLGSYYHLAVFSMLSTSGWASLAFGLLTFCGLSSLRPAIFDR